MAWINFNSSKLAHRLGLLKSCRRKWKAYFLNWNLHEKCKVLDSELYIENQTCRNREIVVWISRWNNNSSNFESVGRSDMWCQIIIFDSQSNANLSVKNFYLDLDGRNQTCSEGQTWLQKSRWIKTISFFGKFGQTKIRRRVRSKFLLPEFFSTKLKLSFETLMEEIKLVVTHQYEFEYWDGIKLRAPFWNFR